MDTDSVYFTNRCDAGRRLASRLTGWRSEHPVVLGLARGGIPVAYEVAHELEAPLDVMVARKLGAPGNPELAIGAVAPNATYLADDTLTLLHVPKEHVKHAIERERAEVTERSRRYRVGLRAVSLENRVVILVDDGIATGATMFAAIDSVKKQGAKRITVATPVCAAQSVRQLREFADEVVYLAAPVDFIAVGVWYEDFSPTDDDEVIAFLKKGQREREAHYHTVAHDL